MVNKVLWVVTGALLWFPSQKSHPKSLNMALQSIFACFYHPTCGAGLCKSLTCRMSNSNGDLEDLVSLGSFICVPALKGRYVLPNYQCKN